MKFDQPATTNPIDQLKVVGKPTDRIDGKYKTTGTAPYAYERHDVVANQAYGYVVGAPLAKGRITSMDTAAAKASPGVLAVVTTLDQPKLPKSAMNTASLFGGPEVQHYHQAIAVVVAETFEQARAAGHADPHALGARAGRVRPGGRGLERAERVFRRQGRRLRDRLRLGAREARRRLHHPRREPRDDGAARLHRRPGTATG